MISKRIRTAGLRLIEEALSKEALALPPPISAPSLGGLKAQKTRQLNTAAAVVPKVLTPPST
jgi:hypothetical protein